MDLNILITTIVAATSVLVAIIGGFLVSKVISLSSERVATQNRLTEINNNITIKKNLLDKVNKWLLWDNADNFIRDNHEKLYHNIKPLEKLIKEDDGETKLTTDELTPYINVFYEIKAEVLDIIDNYNQDSIPSNFHKLVPNRTYLKRPAQKDWYDLIYDIYYQALPAEKPRYDPLGLTSIRPMSMPNIKNLNHAINIPRQKKRRSKVDEQNKLNNKLHELDVGKDEIIRILNNYGRPEGLWWGLLVLFYACLVGIIYPSLLLPYPLDYYNDVQTKILLLSLFFSELLVFLLYLAFNIHKLTKMTKD